MAKSNGGCSNNDINFKEGKTIGQTNPGFGKEGGRGLEITIKKLMVKGWTRIPSFSTINARRGCEETLFLN